MQAAHQVAIVFEEARFLNSAAVYYELAIALGTGKGTLHPVALNALNNLGVLRARQGQKEEAECLFRRALINEHVVATSNLAVMYEEKGDAVDAQDETYLVGELGQLGFHHFVPFRLASSLVGVSSKR